MFRKACVLLIIGFVNSQGNVSNIVDLRPLCPCGSGVSRLDTRIVGGHNAGRGHFPYATALVDYLHGLRNEGKEQFLEENGKLNSFCGATLITDSHVLTAAHCFKSRAATDMLLDVADYNLQTPRDGKLREIVNVTKYPLYHDGSFFTDIAVIRFHPPVRWQSGIRAAILPPRNMKVTPGTIVSAYGWGRLKYEGKHPEILQAVELPVVRNSECQKKFVSRIEPHMLCAGGSEGHDACIGDSGSGLVQRVDNGYVLVGVVSFGIECALPNVAGVYTRVPHFVDWIYEQTLSAGCRPCVLTN